MSKNRYRLTQLKLTLDESTADIPKKISHKMQISEGDISDVEITRCSIDARHKNDIRKVFSVDFSTDRKLDLPEAPVETYQEVPSGSDELKHRPMVIGFGPCGMFAALLLAERGYQPIVVERGYDMETRIKEVERFWAKGVLNPECNVQFGEGGAGTFSDGKLTTGIKDDRKRKVLEEFVEAGAPEDILYMQKPHIGTDVLREVVVNIRKKIESLGGQVIFDARMNHLMLKDGHVTGAVTQKGYQLRYMHADVMVLAIGHSSRDTLESLVDDNMAMGLKPLSIGVRIEHPQEMVDRAQYGEMAGNPALPPAVYNLAHHCRNGRGVYTFCMCPGGEVVVASSETGGVVTNGMSNRNRDSGTANSAVLVDVHPEDFIGGGILAGVDFQRKYERIAFRNGGGKYKAPTCTWAQFRDGAPEAQAVLECLPGFAIDAIREAMPEFGRKLRGFDSDDAVITAVESRSSSPIRMIRDEHYESNIRGLFPGGEGAGHAGGIMSSAVDGLRIAEEIISRYQPLE